MTDATENQASRADAECALESVLASPEFDGSDRLREFLTYVVREALAGRGDEIRGKRVAEDVYLMLGDSGGKSAGVVRVDASRLRRRLDLYYSGSGARDRLRIHIDKGGYTPRFEEVSPPERERDSVRPEPTISVRRGLTLPYWVLLPLVAAALYGGIATLRPPSHQQEVGVPELPDLSSITEREVLFEQATASLKARNAAAEARVMMFPATEPWRVRAAKALYEGAIMLDPSYFGGYAGGAQAVAMIAGVSPPGPERDGMLDRARSLAAKAIELAPAESWSQSALAFLYFVERDYDEANRLSLRAIDLDPNDLQALEMDAIIALFSGEFERAAENAAPEKHRDRDGSRFPWRNAFGNTQFHLGNYDLAIRHLKEAAALGEPISEINSAHLIAALQANGQTDLATNVIEGFEATWPESRVDKLLQQIFQNPDDAANVISRMTAAGWTPAPVSGSANPGSIRSE